MGSLAAINSGAPLNRRAEMVTAFFVFAYIGLTIPVVGVGFLIDTANFVVRTLILAAVLTGLLLVTIVVLLLSDSQQA